MRSVVFTFFVLIVLSAAFVAVGLLIAFLACYLLAMGSLVECGTLCALVFSRMGRPQLAV